jgi:hypothetical protein
MFASVAAIALVGMPATAAGLDYTASSQPAAERTFGPKTVSGSANGFSWTASNTIVGQTPTSGVLPPRNTIGGGDPIYRPSSNKSGVVALIMDYGGGNLFICSGSVLAGGMSIATAAHCVSDGAGTANPLRTTAYFFKGDPDERTPFQTGGVEIDVSRYIVHPDYTGEVIDQNDIAILRLESAAPQQFQRYDLWTNDIDGANFNVAGYGARSTVGGAQGTSTAAVAGRTGFLREGDNKYDYALGDSLFNGGFNFLIRNGAEIEFSFVSDFDNGLRANDAARLAANAIGQGPLGDIFFDDVGRGAREVGIAGGDSGGPGFIAGRLASINSYGLTFGTNFGDFLGAVPPSPSALNNSWGEFSGYVPVFIHTDFIASAMAVPEPSSWALLIAGFGLTGAAMRRQRKAAITA